MDAVIAFEVPLGENLAGLSRALDEAYVPHRVYERGGVQVVAVPDEPTAEVVRDAYARWRAGRFGRELPHRAGGGLVGGVWRQLAAVPLTSLVLLAMLACFPLSWPLSRGEAGLVPLLTLPGFQVRDGYVVFGSLAEVFASGQVWRLFSPALLHFGGFHLLFNGLWMWVLGMRIESRHGGGWWLAVVLAADAGGNLLQYAWFGSGLFGGMSGVVYGLSGYALVWHVMRPARRFDLPGGVYVFMVLWLVLGVFGVIDLFGVAVANGAHVGGLAAGLAVGGLRVLADRWRPPGG